jgi:hypothetical protein
MNVVWRLAGNLHPRALHATVKPQTADFGFALGTAVEPQSVPEGERKMVTALFVDIMDSTEVGPPTSESRFLWRGLPRWSTGLDFPGQMNLVASLCVTQTKDINTLALHGEQAGSTITSLRSV